MCKVDRKRFQKLELEHQEIFHMEKIFEISVYVYEIPGAIPLTCNATPPQEIQNVCYFFNQKFFDPKFSDQNFLWTQNFFGGKFYGHEIFSTKIFLIRNFFGPKICLNPNFF